MSVVHAVISVIGQVVKRAAAKFTVDRIQKL